MFRVIICLSFWIASLGNLALWHAHYGLAEVQGLRGLWLCLATGIMIAALMHALLSLCAWRGVLKMAGVVCLLAAASGSYFMLAYGVILDTPMMHNLLATDTREVSDLLNWRLALTVLVLGVLPSIWLCRQVLSAKPFRTQLLRNLLSFALMLAIAIASVLAVFQDFSALHRNHMALRSLINPLSSFYSLAEIATEPLWGKRGAVQAIGMDAVVQPNRKPPLIVLVVGETARSGNFGINGYHRDTTPLLSQLAQAQMQTSGVLISQQEVWSCGTSTETSLPCMFSHLGKAGYESSRERFESLLDVLQRAGLAVLWIDNQSGCKGVCNRVPNASMTGEALDEIMLEGLDARIALLAPAQRAKGVVVVLHQMGSHGPAYYKRSPPNIKTFAPECTNNALASCNKAEVVNAYDNSIRYTDYFLATTVKWLQAFANKASGPIPSAMIYLADHGESLGENNLYLHGLPYAVAPDVQKRVPWMTWLSPDFVTSQKINTACLQERARERLSHDNYFHSVLGLAGVATKLYKRELDIYAACR
ncbi:MAG: phosphoethanolamine--lipid A transferase [Cytophagales bacterium]|nr:phosphoethanolamine--lipid A transferase [Cytophagales bacterium]